MGWIDVDAMLDVMSPRQFEERMIADIFDPIDIAGALQALFPSKDKQETDLKTFFHTAQRIAGGH